MLKYFFNFLNIFNYFEETEIPTLTPHSLSPLPKGKFYNEIIGKVRKNIIL